MHIKHLAAFAADFLTVVWPFYEQSWLIILLAQGFIIYAVM